MPKGRRTFCGDACVDDFVVATGHSGPVRAAVFRRDQGVCQLCGFDTEAFSAQLRRVIRGMRRWKLWQRLASLEAAILERRGWGPNSSHLWEADHVVPVAKGGGGCGLDGYRTLCVRCHRAETARLAAELAAQRREGAA